jgi:hypothetical protein
MEKEASASFFIAWDVRLINLDTFFASRSAYQRLIEAGFFNRWQHISDGL